MPWLSRALLTITAATACGILLASPAKFHTLQGGSFGFCADSDGTLFALQSPAVVFLLPVTPTGYPEEQWASTTF